MNLINSTILNVIDYLVCVMTPSRCLKKGATTFMDVIDNLRRQPQRIFRVESFISSLQASTIANHSTNKIHQIDPTSQIMVIWQVQTIFFILIFPSLLGTLLSIKSHIYPMATQSTWLKVEDPLVKELLDMTIPTKFICLCEVTSHIDVVCLWSWTKVFSFTMM